VLLHRRSAAAEVVALAAGDAPHHVQDRSADTQGADDVHLHDAISPWQADRRDVDQTEALCLLVRTEFARRAFSVAEPTVYNSLPASFTGWLKKLTRFCTPYNFIKCWPIFKVLSLSESGENL